MKRLIEKIQYTLDERLKIIQKILEDQENGKKIVCYGMGVYAKMLTEFLQQYGIKIDQYCVDVSYIDSINKDKTDVRDIEQFVKENANFSLIIAFQNYKKAMEIINEKNLGDSIYYIDDIYNFFKLDYDYFLRNYHKFEQTYHWLADTLSKKVFEAFINTRISGNPEEIFKLRSSEDNQYHYELLKLSKNEIFVDCGAYNGDTIKSFLQYTENSYHKIYAFEPDKNNCSEIKRNVKIDNFICIEKGVWERSDILSFHARGGNGTASSFQPHKDKSITKYREENQKMDQVAVISIDEVLDGEKATFIKMDIEGSELMALKGAKETIKKYKPKLAICVYHRVDDLITIPQYINSLFMGEEVYCFYIRHHSVSLAETVLYAIPKSEKS